MALGQKESRINLADGERQEAINVSEGEMQRRINEADGRAKEIQILAEAMAGGISRIAASIRKPGGAEAIRMRILEQYKSLVGDIGNVGTRYATANGFYVSVLTALLGVLAYTGSGKPFDEIKFPIIALVAVFAISICWIWRKTIQYYGNLFGGKFAVLKELEKSLDVQVYALEYVEVYKNRNAGYLTTHEAKVPLFLGWLFAFVAAAAIVLAVYSSACAL